MSIVDLRGQMPVASNPPEGFYPRRVEGAINKVVVHHSATTSGNAFAYANWHISNNGWETIAYHFVIDKDGTINHTLDLTKKGWHGNSANGSSVGICLTGHFDQETPTLAQVESLIWLIHYLESYLGRELAIDPHYKYNTGKTCPGSNFDIELIRRSVRDFTTPPWTNPSPGATQTSMSPVVIAAGLLLLIAWKR